MLLFAEGVPIYEYIINFEIPTNVDRALKPDPDSYPVTSFGMYGDSIV